MKKYLTALLAVTTLAVPANVMAAGGSDFDVAAAHALLASAPIAAKAVPAAASADDDSEVVGSTRSFSLRRLPDSAQAVGAAATRTIQAPRRSSHRAPVAVAAAQHAPDLKMTFANGSDVLTPGAQRWAASIAVAMVQDGQSYLIQGHTDARGAPAANLDLSRRRAGAVVKYLVDHGVPAERLKAEGYGADVPLPAHNAYDPANRRVEVMRQS